MGNIGDGYMGLLCGVLQPLLFVAVIFKYSRQTVVQTSVCKNLWFNRAEKNGNFQYLE